MPLSPFSFCCKARLQFIGTHDTFICSSCKQIIPPCDENNALSSPDKKASDTNTSSPHNKDHEGGVWFQIQNGKKRSLSPSSESASSDSKSQDKNPGESASSDSKSQDKNPGVDRDKPDNSWNEWGNPPQIAVNGSNESPQDRTLGCFISQSFTSPKTNEQQQRPVQTNATAPEPKKTSLPPSQNAGTWGFGEPTSNKSDPKKRPAQTKRDKKQKTTATSPTSNLPPHAGEFNKETNCHQFDFSSFPQHANTEEGAAILLDPIIKNIFGNPNEDAMNGQVLVCLDPRAGRYFICINNDHNNKNWRFCKHLVQGNSQPGPKAPPTRYFNAPGFAVGILCAIHYLYSNLPANLLREIESAVGFTGLPLAPTTPISSTPLANLMSANTPSTSPIRQKVTTPNHPN
jgi:hypothetical protein